MPKLLDKALSTNSVYQDEEQIKQRINEIEELFRTRQLFAIEWEQLCDERIELIKELKELAKTLNF